MRSLASWELSYRSYLVEKGKWKPSVSTRLNKSQQVRSYDGQSNHIIVLRQIYKVIQEAYDERSEYEKDIWDLRKLGVFVNLSSSSYKLNFTKIALPWLRQVTKQFIRYSLSTICAGECQNRIANLKTFSNFLIKYHPSAQPADINRQMVVEYLSYLVSNDLSANTRLRYISQLRTFLEMCVTEGWADIPDKRLIYSEDFPQHTRAQPRFIPEDVLIQLNQNLDDLPPSIKRMVLILQEGGMRIGELCRMPINCLMQDVHGDWFLRYYQYKMKKEHSIPISREVAAVIQEQQQAVREECNKEFPYLFPSLRHWKKGRPIKQKVFADTLNRLAYDKDIRDANGCLWHFQSHQFRHTVGTRMINNGVPQHIIQRYLGHESPEMTARYAHIHDQTLKEEFTKFKGKVVDVMGKVVEPEIGTNSSPDLQWMKKSILAQALPNGSCALPIVAGPCPHANACLTCTHFRTTSEFLGEHKKQLEQTNQIIGTALGNNWVRQVEMNEKVKENLERIITSLEGNQDDEA
jgi:integrase